MNTILNDGQMMIIMERAHQERNIAMREFIGTIVGKPLDWLSKGVRRLVAGRPTGPVAHPTKTATRTA